MSCRLVLEYIRLLLLLWSVAGVLFSALAVGTCEFISIPGADISNPDEGGVTFTGLIGLFRIQEKDPSGNSYCVETPGYITDQFGIYFQVAQLMGVIALTSGGVATIVLLMTFLIEMCCPVTGLQYGLGIIYIVAAVSQGLTFMAIGDSACSQYVCSTSTSSIWSIVATSLYFIAMIQSFAAPFPKEKICSRETCCQCCKKKDDNSSDDDQEEVGGEDIEAAAVVDNDAALAAGVAAGGAAGAGIVTVAVADKDKEDSKADNSDASREEDAETALGATAGTATMVEGDGEDEAVDMTVLDDDNAALDREEAALAVAEENRTKSKSLYESAKE